MTFSEGIILFWVLPALVTVLSGFIFIRLDGSTPEQEYERDDSFLFVCTLGAVFWPMVCIAVFVVNILPCLLKEYTLRKKK